jgi:hypothetical protein
MKGKAMKATAIRSRFWVALLLALCTHQTASAYYDPGEQRWINRDPIQEQGGLNIYQFVANNPSSKADVDGRYLIPTVRDVKECGKEDWIAANQGCKKDYGCWSVVATCYLAKLVVEVGPFWAGAWVIVYTCSNIGNDPMG